MIDKRLERFYEDACDILDSLDIEYGPVRSVTVNTRAKTRWGQCRHSKFEDIYDIEICSRLLAPDVSYTDVMDTVLHELLHCHKDRMCHTGEWKRCAELVNLRYGYDIQRAASSAEKNIANDRLSTAKYIVTCNGCGSVSGYLKKGKIVKILLKQPNGTCKCSICGSNSFTVKTN